MPGIEVVPEPPGGLPLADGFGRRKAFETENVRMGETRLGPGAVSRWHHHGAWTLYGFVVLGRLTLEFGPRGVHRISPTAGEFFRIPPGLTHRDVNGTSSNTHIVNVIVGEGPTTIEVDGPDE